MCASHPPVCSFVAWSGTGKTTLLERLIPCLAAAGLRVAVIKHDGHDALALGETDSARLARAGAKETAVLTDTQTLIHRQRATTLTDLVECLDADLILTEGFKTGPYPKVLVYRAGVGEGFAVDPNTCLAVVSDDPIATETPVFGFSEVKALADHLMRTLACDGGAELRRRE